MTREEWVGKSPCEGCLFLAIGNVPCHYRDGIVQVPVEYCAVVEQERFLMSRLGDDNDAEERFLDCRYKEDLPSKELYFGEGFVELLESGERRVTIRAGQRDFEPDEAVVAICAEGDRFLIQITSCDHYHLRYVPEKDLVNDGFVDDEGRASAKVAVRRLRSFYPDLNLGSIVSVVRFKVAWRLGGVV